MPNYLLWVFSSFELILIMLTFCPLVCYFEPGFFLVKVNIIIKSFPTDNCNFHMTSLEILTSLTHSFDKAYRAHKLGEINIYTPAICLSKLDHFRKTCYEETHFSLKSLQHLEAPSFMLLWGTA